ncbi:helix-turn-helix domain-containing protein [Oleidesulfovibrio sp.]|uniref:AlbA family DNA-binding domain-containing protein n=1 Tax=Oleidesulfovibrio sp. TaxID=2909707 RepID=UPI003A8974B4
MRIPKTAYAVIAATLLAVLLFIVFNTAIVGRLITGIAVDFFVDATRQSLLDTRARMTALLADNTKLDGAAESEVFREAMRTSGATGVAVFKPDGKGVYFDSLTGRRANIPALSEADAQSHNASSESISLIGTQKASGSPLPLPASGTTSGNSTRTAPKAPAKTLSENLDPELTRWLRSHIITSMEVAPALTLLDVTPEMANGRLVYMIANAGGSTAFLLYTPESLAKNLVQFFPHAEAVISVNDNVIAISGGFIADLEKANADDERLTLESITKHRDGGYGVTAETFISSQSSGFAITLLSRDVNLLSLLLRDTRFLAGTAVLLATLFIIITAYALHAGRTRRAYKPNKPLSNSQIGKLLRQGEGDHVEFKSTLRFNLKSEKNDKNIELASLKGITAFLNTAGGTLLIGVNDDGEVLGIAQDKFNNDDHALRHLSNLVADHIGIRHINDISMHAVTINGKTILAAVCRQAVEPAFLKHKEDEYCFVRQGPGNRQLTISEFWQFSKKFL